MYDSKNRNLNAKRKEIHTIDGAFFRDDSMRTDWILKYQKASKNQKRIIYYRCQMKTEADR